jgi:hypothetical protein
MLNKLMVILIAGFIMVSIGTSAMSEIVIEDAASVWTKPLMSMSPLATDPRIIAEYASTLVGKELVFPGDLSASASEVAPRVVVEYATTIKSYDLTSFPCLGDFDEDGDVDGSDLSFFEHNIDKLPLFLFTTCYGRSD